MSFEIVPDVKPEAVKVFDNAKTTDGFDNFLSRVGLRNNNTLSGSTYTFNLLTRNRVKLEEAYRGSWIVGAIIDSMAEDMTRAGLMITTNEGEKDIKDLKNAISRLQVSQSFCDLAKWGGLYGGALGVIQIRGQDLATPLNLESVGKDQFQGVVVYDRWQLNPDVVEVIDSGPDMGLPKFYSIVSNLDSTSPSAPTATGEVKVHFSRCIRNIGIKLPYFQAITEMMWGESKLERLWDRLVSFDNASMSSANLIERANNRTVSVENLREIISNGGGAYEGLLKFFEVMRTFQTNEGLTLIDKEDLFQTTSYSFSGLSDMMLQFGQQLSGACGIPLVRLFGQSPAGLSATGDADIRMYYDKINSQQEASFRNGWDIVLKVMWRSCFGKEAPKDLEFSFAPLWQMDATEKAINAKTMTETVIGAFDVGLIKKSTAMQELRQNSGDTGVFSNISDDEIAEAEEMEDEPPMPGEVDPGTPVPGQPASQGAGEAVPPAPIKPPTPVPSLDKKSGWAFKNLFKGKS